MTALPAIGDHVDILQLRSLKRDLRISIYVYLDQEIAETSDLLTDIEKYRFTDPDFRPVLEIEEFLKHMQKQMRQIAGPSADLDMMLQGEPLHAAVLEIGEMATPAGPRTYLKTLLPYLDEMEEIAYANAGLPE
jgi:hypothetical protein